MEGLVECCMAVIALMRATLAARDALDRVHRQRRARRLRLLARATEEMQMLEHTGHTEESEDFEEYLIVRNRVMSGVHEALFTLRGTIRQSPVRHRRLWVSPSNKQWWDEFIMSVWSDERWQAFFRMPRTIFLKLVEALRPEIAKQDTNMRRAIPAEKRVAIAVWLLAHRRSYAAACNQFGVGRSTVAAIFIEVVLAMEKVLLPRTIYLGDPQKIMDGFAELGFPQVIAAVDGCQVNIVSPVRQGNKFINRKNSYSILLQGTCDHTGRFVDMEIGWSGENHGDRVIKNSTLYKTMEAGVFVPGNPSITLCGKQIGPLILADWAYPIRKWLLTPFRGSITPRQALYNKCHSRAKNVVERAFGRLKARWRCLTASLEVAEENVPSVISACVILHNICETQGRVLEENPHGGQNYDLDSLGAPLVNTEDQKEKEGEAVRDVLMEFFWQQAQQQ